MSTSSPLLVEECFVSNDRADKDKSNVGVSKQGLWFWNWNWGI